jgi:hypothetical protein
MGRAAMGAREKRRFQTLLFLILSLPPLFARDVQITTEDGELNIALEGAVIRSWDGTEYSCDESGRALISVPEDRQVVIRVAYPGYENAMLVIPLTGDRFTVSLRLSGIMENRELVIEAPVAGTDGTVSGRSVSIEGKELARRAEIGIVEDVMTAVKLLPGVGYTGSFNALPSIRGGDPQDMAAVFDGFYIENPYHWGGLVSIFDPKMVERAKLSHGVFSARYGHTISGLLEVESKKASSEDAELEMAVSSSATSLNLSYPLKGKGGIMAMGKLTYWDPFIALAKLVIREAEYVRVAPYIRSGAFSSYYRFSGDLEWSLNGFFGTDGIGVSYQNQDNSVNMISWSDSNFDWENRTGFLSTALTFNPRNTMLLKASLGGGFSQVNLDGQRNTSVLFENAGGRYFVPGLNDYAHLTQTTARYQVRADFDWDLGRGFLFAAGLEELCTQWIQRERLFTYYEQRTPAGDYLNYPIEYVNDIMNSALGSSAYGLLEYLSASRRFGAELGLRLDHLYFIGRDFTIQTLPVLNPRLNLDFGILKNRGILDSLTATAGTGLFSSVNEAVAFLESRNFIDDFDLKQNRSWTSVAGIKFDFGGGIKLNIEGYYKYIFDRAYVYADINPLRTTANYRFDGVGRVWGFDMMLQKLESRYWDGWLTYSFNHARYRDPSTMATDLNAGSLGSGMGTNWYYPYFHRFHTLNLILNIKPTRGFNIAARFGFAGGVPKKAVGIPTMHWVTLADGTPIPKFKRSETYSDTARTTASIPMDLKFSFYRFDKNGKVQTEIYFSVENIQSLFYSPKTNKSINEYTGQEEEGSDDVSYELPIPLISFGLKWSY